MLPTDKAENSIVKYAGQLFYFEGYFTQEYLRSQEKYSHHLYIVDDSEIKEGDYCIEDIGGTVFGPYRNGDVVENPKKIIGTTDTSLVINAVDTHEVQGQVMQSHYHKELPQIPQSFIESYCQNPVEKVMVEYESYIKETSECDYALERPKLTSNNELIIHQIEEKLYTREEVKEIIIKVYSDLEVNRRFDKGVLDELIKENL